MLLFTDNLLATTSAEPRIPEQKSDKTAQLPLVPLKARIVGTLPSREAQEHQSHFVQVRRDRGSTNNSAKLTA
jgi:hypothetical protein